MAKKSSTNAVKKIDKQIEKLKENVSDIDDKTPVITKKELKKEIEKKIGKSTTKKATTKKKTTTKKDSTKSTTKKTTTKKTTTKKGTTKKSTTKVKKDDIIVAPAKKIKAERPKKKEDKAVRDKVVVTPTKAKKKTTTNKKTNTKKDDIIVVPKKDEIVNDEKEDIKEDVSESTKVKRILNKEKKFEFVEEDNNNEEIDDYKFVEEIEDDITNGKYINKAKILIDKSEKDNKVKRKRKGKNKYVIDLESTREYKDLERDLRSLYDKTNDIIEDIDKPQDLSKTVKNINDLVITDVESTEKSGVLDRISQKALNLFVTVLSIVFIILLIVVIAFVIYISTV